MMMKTTALCLAASVSLMALASPASAQDQNAPASDAENNTIVVTAQRRVEKVTEVPISITVADAQQLERQQVNSVNDLSRIAASLEIQSAPGQNTGGGGMIRGVGTQTFAAGASASVGIIVDQVSQGNANVGDLFDVSRIEVLKGPQGTLFGLTTSAGAINITTNAPDPSAFSARLRTELSAAGFAGSKFGNQVLQGVVNVPLADNAAIRLSGLANLRQGVNYNRAVSDYVHTNRFVLRGRLRWEPSDALTFNLIGDFNTSRASYGGDFLTYLRAPADITAELASCGITPSVGNRDFCSTRNPGGRTRNYGGSLQVDYDLGPATLTSITAARRTESEPSGLGTITRIDPAHVQLFTGPNGGGHGSLFSQELRLSSPSGSRLEYTAGLFYSRQASYSTPNPFQIRVQLAPDFFIFPVNDLGLTANVVDKSWAVFGQGTFHVTDQLSLIAGLRYTETQLSLDQTPVATGIRTRADQGAEEISYKFGAQYQITPNSMIYATASRGFKGGQIAIPTGAAPVVLDPEIPNSYEVGYKATLFGGWVLDLNAFYQKFNNFQGQTCLTDSTGRLICTQANVPNVVSKGAEVSVFGRINRNFSIASGFIYANTSYPDNFLGDDGTDIGGTQLTNAPRYKFTFSGEYRQDVSENLRAFVSADAVWKSKIRYGANSNVNTMYPDHWIVGGRLGISTSDDRFTAAIFVRNLFNEHEPFTLIANSTELLAGYSANSFRQVGLSLDAKF